MKRCLKASANIEDLEQFAHHWHSCSQIAPSDHGIFSQRQNSNIYFANMQNVNFLPNCTVFCCNSIDKLILFYFRLHLAVWHSTCNENEERTTNSCYCFTCASSLEQFVFTGLNVNTFTNRAQCWSIVRSFTGWETFSQRTGVKGELDVHRRQTEANWS